MKYVCEVCNQQFDTAPEAQQCEFAHKQEKAKAEAQSRAEIAISEAVNAYIAKYKTVPAIEITGENHSILLDALAGNIGEALSIFVDILCSGDECDECADCEGCNSTK